MREQWQFFASVLHSAFHLECQLSYHRTVRRERERERERGRIEKTDNLSEKNLKNLFQEYSINNKLALGCTRRTTMTRTINKRKKSSYLRKLIRRDEVVSVGCLGCLDHLLVGHVVVVFETVGNILTYRRVEQKWLLADKSNVLTKLVHV